MADRLYLIGNGFDIHHEIKSKYSDFKKWLEVNRWSLYSRMFQVYELCGTDLWSTFEDGLGDISPEAILGQNVYAPFVIEDRINDEYLNSEDMSEIMPEIGYTLSRLFYELQDAFRDWIYDLNAPDETKKLSFPIDGSQFISFNYTQTLESLYGIQAERILYIHGCVSKNTDLIFGHNKTKEDILLPWGTAKTEDDADLLSEAANELSILYKPVQSIITSHSPYWERLSDVSNIHVWGMSLSDVDVQYLSHIKSITNEYVEWEFSCFTPDDDKRVSTVIQQLELKNFKKCRLNDYE